jgi:hypothetical protein
MKYILPTISLCMLSLLMPLHTSAMQKVYQSYKSSPYSAPALIAGATIAGIGVWELYNNRRNKTLSNQIKASSIAAIKPDITRPAISFTPCPIAKELVQQVNNAFSLEPHFNILRAIQPSDTYPGDSTHIFTDAIASTAEKLRILDRTDSAHLHSAEIEESEATLEAIRLHTKISFKVHPERECTSRREATVFAHPEFCSRLQDEIERLKESIAKIQEKRNKHLRAEAMAKDEKDYNIKEAARKSLVTNLELQKTRLAKRKLIARLIAGAVLIGSGIWGFINYQKASSYKA